MKYEYNIFLTRIVLSETQQSEVAEVFGKRSRVPQDNQKESRGALTPVFLHLA